jgi:hypothetical protein
VTVAFDASVLVYLLTPGANPPVDPATGLPVDRCADRVQYLIDTLEKSGQRIIIPTPALAEVLVHAQQAAAGFIGTLRANKHFRVVAFDERAAVEYATSQVGRPPIANHGQPGARAKAKFDDQIVAIAAIEGATVIYSDDTDLVDLVNPGVQVIGVADLPLPPEDAQGQLPLAAPAAGHPAPEPGGDQILVAAAAQGPGAEA